jgi:serine/threonine protein kinase
VLQKHMTLQPGTIVRDDSDGESYIIEEILGTGGFSAVYRVRDEHTKQQIFALKELINPDREDKRKFTLEAELLMRLDHPSLPHVFRFFEVEATRRVYLLMDYIEGKNLEVLRMEQNEQHFSLASVFTLMNPIVEAINYLHAQKVPIVHRDIKPSNIIVPTKPGIALLVDFGLAKEHSEDRTTNVFRYGTPGYAAPEQYKHGTNTRTDIYGLAATIYTLLTGEVPVDALTRTLSQPDGDPLLPADRINSEVPASVASVIEHAMELRLESRYATVDEFWSTLHAAAEHPDTIGASTESLVPSWLTLSRSKASTLQSTDRGTLRHSPQRDYAGRPVRTPRSKTMLLLLAIIIFLAGITVAFFLFWSSSLSHQPPPTPVAQRMRALTATVTPNPCSIATTNAPPASPYPVLASCYSGTIDDLGVGNAKSGLFLTNIVQNQGNISGNFNGLGMTGTFKGTITSTGKLHFVVHINGKSDLLDFTGESKIGGDIKGNFTGLDSNGKPTLDEYGVWYSQPYPFQTPTT